MTTRMRASRPSTLALRVACSSICSTRSLSIVPPERLRSAPVSTSRSSIETSPSADIIRYIASRNGPYSASTTAWSSALSGSPTFTSTLAFCPAARSWSRRRTTVEVESQNIV